ncbi:FAD-dependent oxidoreductase [Cloacibacterium rupense]|uniref:FAD-dependent oxidoreductase n=1 Tax=Cloacibacterium rupense TaxID=517423 RepID=A0ABQ2NK89_9FLAO|nr:FAD-dependent oxidoreductase [Cloacibacterium rupense]GGP04336.1 FAD-dependent oxidoreductase [Cloacibacterium rupense]
MKNVDYIIVGDGYAALFFAHQLIKNKKSFYLFSEGKRSASFVSAGIINPAVLKRFTTFWLAQEQINALKITLSEIEVYTHKNYLIEKPILRVFHDEKEKELWLKKSNEISFLSKDFLRVNSVKNPFECGLVNQSARLNVRDFFTDLINYLEQNDHLIKEKFNYNMINTEKSIYKDIQFKSIIFAEGMGVKDNPFFSDIPVNPNKGHHLEVRLSEKIEEDFTIKKKHFIFPLIDNTYYYGGTYDRDQIHHKIDDSAVEKLTNALSEFYPNDFDVINVKFGFRPTVKDRRPIIGNHSRYKNFYVFNGLGARGILNGNYFAINLYQHLETGEEIHPEVNLKRFQ